MKVVDWAVMMVASKADETVSVSVTGMVALMEEWKDEMTVS